MALQDQLIAEQGKLAEMADEMDAISNVATDENRELSEQELNLLEEYGPKIDGTKKRIESLQKSVASAARSRSRTEQQTAIEEESRQLATVPARHTEQARVRVPNHRKSRHFSTSLEAYQSGMWMAATLGRNQRAQQYCRDNHVGGWTNAMEEGTDTLGGYSVPDPLANTIIELFQQFGVFVSNARGIPMTGDTLRVPKLPEFPRTGEKPDSSLTVVYPDEGAAITPSDLTFGQELMTARKSAVIALWSTELNEDSVISMTDLLARDIARTMAWDYDKNAFLGDGTGTYNSITGVFNALAAGATVTLGAGATGATDITLADLNKMVGILSDYPGLMPKYYMHKSVYWDVVVPLLQTAGGTNMPQLQDGPGGRLNGHDVVFTQVLPKSDAAAGSDLIVCGDLDLGAYAATRRQVSIRVLTELYAASDQLAIVSTMRADALTHSVGGDNAGDCGCISKLALAAV